MNELAIICRYGREHGMTYGRVVELLSVGRLTREEIGLPPLEPQEEKKEAAEEKPPKKQNKRRELIRVGGKLVEKV